MAALKHNEVHGMNLKDRSRRAWMGGESVLTQALQLLLWHANMGLNPSTLLLFLRLRRPRIRALCTSALRALLH